VSIALLLRKAAKGKPGSQEDRLCAHSTQNEVETELQLLERETERERERVCERETERETERERLL
jgi:hypothetical protein